MFISDKIRFIHYMHEKVDVHIKGKGVNDLVIDDRVYDFCSIKIIQSVTQNVDIIRKTIYFQQKNAIHCY